jgi:hypothetical protein
MRSEILKQAGCTVFSPATNLEAILAVSSERYDVLVVCDETDFQVAEELCQRFRAGNPGNRIVVIQSVGKELPCTKAKADAIVGSYEPQALVDAVCPQKKAGQDDKVPAA